MIITTEPTRTLLRLCCLLLFSASLSAQTVTEHTLHSDVLRMDRSVWVYTPWWEEDPPEERAPATVLFVFDAQNRAMFDLVHSTVSLFAPWNAPVLVVGVQSAWNPARKWNRNTELLPPPENKRWIKNFGGFAGKGDSLLLHLTSELIPWVEARYPTLPRRALLGHSNGATFALYALLNAEPEVFTDVIALSPNFRYDDNRLGRRLIDALREDNKQPFRPTVFLSRANESNATGFYGWDTAAAVVHEQIVEPAVTANYAVTTASYPERDHMTGYPFGVLDGLLALFSDMYTDGTNAAAYYQWLGDDNHQKLTPDLLNNAAYTALQANHPKDALVLIQLAVKTFPEQDDNLHDSHGEILLANDQPAAAEQAFVRALEILEQRRSDLDDADYKRRKAAYRDRLTSLRKSSD